jgi:hypothetical protein
MNIKYLNNVLRYILEDTVIERRVDDNYINFPFFDGDDKFYPLSMEFLPTNFFYKPVSFYEYCRDMYGLTEDESQYIWEQYRNVIRNNTITESINESVNISDNKRFNDYVINDIIKNTSLEGHHFYLFDCNISVHLNHSRYNPFFEWVPECFYTIMDRHYGLDFDVSNKIWNWYGQYIIDLYLEDFNK